DCFYTLDFLLILLRLPYSSLLPYTTLFRSRLRPADGRDPGGRGDRAPPRAHADGGRSIAPHLRLRQLGRGGGRPGHRHRPAPGRSEEHTSELQSRENLVCRLLLEKKKKKRN